MDVDTIILRKQEILSEISIHQKKLITLETELLKIEHMMANFSELNIAESLSLSEQQKEIVDYCENNHISALHKQFALFHLNPIIQD